MDPRAWIIRYRPYLAIVAAVAALIALLPGDPGTADLATGPGVTVGPGATTVDADGNIVPGAGSQTTGGPGTVAGAPTSSAARSGTTQAGGPSVGGPGPLAVVPEAAASADCDPATGRIRVPTIYAPPCVPAHSGSNGGATYQGVTDTSIKVVVFGADEDPAVGAALTAAGAQNRPEERRATVVDYVDYFNTHYETYGRQVEVVFREGSGATDDDNAARADALKIATEDKPFAVIGAPTSLQFVEVLAANRILCICTVSQPQELYERLAPYVGYTSLMSSTQGYVHRAEYVAKRLAGRNAVHAGTRDGIPMSTQARSFGLLWYETPDGAYRSGVEFFERELGRYGVGLTESRPYPSDLAETQERARPLIQAMKQAGVTTIIFSGDPLSPALLTREATNQNYFPEWIITGSALTDTTLFARTFDQLQWANAFGISFLTARSPEENGTAFRVHQWHHGRAPTADNQYGVIYPSYATLFNGIHMAGPTLTVESWRNGLFSIPATGAGRVTAGTVSYGQQGLWPFIDYTGLDDVTEIWWDPSATGPDEVGNVAIGMYRYVDGGRRYLPGQHPGADPNVFTTDGSVTTYPAPPPGEEHPDYPRPAR